MIDRINLGYLGREIGDIDLYEYLWGTWGVREDREFNYAKGLLLGSWGTRGKVMGTCNWSLGIPGVPEGGQEKVVFQLGWSQSIVIPKYLLFRLS